MTADDHRGSAANRGIEELTTESDESVEAILRESGDPDAFVAFDASDDGSLPAFPLDALPPMFRELAGAFASTIDQSPDLVVPAMFATLGAALGQNWKVKARSFVRPPSIWCCVVATPGAGKTPAIEPVVAPLHEEDIRLREKHAREVEREGIDGDTGGQPPRRERCVVTNLTVEGLTADLEGRPRGLLVHSDEIAQLIRSLDGYSSASAGRGRSAILSIWSGVRVAESRKSVKAADVDAPFVAVYGGTQPAMLHDLDLSVGDGLTPRFLWWVPCTRPGGLGFELDPERAERWHLAVNLALGHQIESPQSADKEGEALISRALLRWNTIATALDTHDHPLVATMYGKAGDHCMRILAVLHGMEAIADTLARVEGSLTARPVRQATLQRAIVITEAFLAHGRAVSALVGGAPRSTIQHADQDRALIEALEAVLGDESSIVDSAARWRERLQPFGYEASPGALGWAFRRLQKRALKRIRVSRPPRGADRTWRVEKATKATKASGSVDNQQDRQRSAGDRNDESDVSDETAAPGDDR